MGTEIISKVSAFEIKGMKFGIPEGVKQLELKKSDTNEDGVISACDKGFDDEAVAKLYLEKFKPGLGEHASFFVNHVSAYQDVKKAYASLSDAGLGLDCDACLGVGCFVESMQWFGMSLDDMRFKLDCHDVLFSMSALITFYNPDAFKARVGGAKFEPYGSGGWISPQGTWGVGPFAEEPDRVGLFPHSIGTYPTTDGLTTFDLDEVHRQIPIRVGVASFSLRYQDPYDLPITKMREHDLWPVVSTMVEDMASKWKVVRRHPKSCVQNPSVEHMLLFGLPSVLREGAVEEEKAEEPEKIPE